MRLQICISRIQNTDAKFELERRFFHAAPCKCWRPERDDFNMKKVDRCGRQEETRLIFPPFDPRNGMLGETGRGEPLRCFLYGARGISILKPIRRRNN